MTPSRASVYQNRWYKRFKTYRAGRSFVLSQPSLLSKIHEEEDVDFLIAMAVARHRCEGETVPQNYHDYSSPLDQIVNAFLSHPKDLRWEKTIDSLKAMDPEWAVAGLLVLCDLASSRRIKYRIKDYLLAKYDPLRTMDEGYTLLYASIFLEDDSLLGRFVLVSLDDTGVTYYRYANGGLILGDGIVRLCENPLIEDFVNSTKGAWGVGIFYVKL